MSENDASIPLFRLSESAIETIADGQETPSLARTFEEQLYGRRNLLILALCSEYPYSDEAPDALKGRDIIALDTLVRVEQEAPHIARDVITEPATGAWLTHTYRQIEGTLEREPIVPLWVHKGYFGALVAAAAMRAGIAADLYASTYGGAVILPGLGRARVSEDTGSFDVARIEVDPSASLLRVHGKERTVEVPDPQKESAFWEPCRFLRAGTGEHNVRIELDDLNPYGNIGGPRAPGTNIRLDESTAEEWNQKFGAAWDIFVRDHPHRAAENARVRSIVPKGPAARFKQYSSTNVTNASSMLVALPRSPLQFVEAMVHEFGHIKLYNALGAVGAESLFTDDSAYTDQVLYSPWRDDPRPLRGQLIGAHASFEIALLWKERNAIDTGEDLRLTQLELALWQHKLPEGVVQLQAGVDKMTKLGRRIVQGMVGRLPIVQGEVVSDEINSLAKVVTLGHQALWRGYHLQPSSLEAIRNQEYSWAATQAQVRPDLAACNLDALASLARFMVTAPDEFNEVRRQPEVMADIIPGATPADTALIAGDPETARRLYFERLEEQPGDPIGIAGLGLVELTQNPGPVADVLLRWPQNVRDSMLQTSRTTSPIEVARQLAAS